MLGVPLRGRDRGYGSQHYPSSSDLSHSLSTGKLSIVVFRLIDPMTDTVISNTAWSQNFACGQYFWISMGNNWGPNINDYDTPEKWGLDWTPNSVFGFRGIIEAYPWPVDGSGLCTADAFQCGGRL